jgi:hypothetical protein
MHETVLQMDETDLGYIEARRQKAEIPIKRLCKEAEIDASTYTRWMQTMRGLKGTLPNYRSLCAVKEALIRLEKRV